MSKKIEVVELYNAALTVAAGATKSLPVYLNNYKPSGYFSLYVKTAGPASTLLKIEQMVSHDPSATDFHVPRDKSGIVADNIAASHPIGTRIYPVTPVLAPWLCVQMTASNANATNVLIKLAIM